MTKRLELVISFAPNHRTYPIPQVCLFIELFRSSFQLTQPTLNGPGIPTTLFTTTRLRLLPAPPEFRPPCHPSCKTRSRLSRDPCCERSLFSLMEFYSCFNRGPPFDTMKSFSASLFKSTSPPPKVYPPRLISPSAPLSGLTFIFNQFPVASPLAHYAQRAYPVFSQESFPRILSVGLAP